MEPHEFIGLGVGMPPETEDLCRHGYRLAKFLKQPWKPGKEIYYLTQLVMLVRGITSRLLFVLGEASKEGTSEEVEKFKKDVKDLETAVLKRDIAKMSLRYRSGIALAQAFDVLQIVKMKYGERFPPSYLIKIVDQVLEDRYNLYKEAISKALWMARMGLNIEPLLKELEDVAKEYIEPYFTEAVRIDIRKFVRNERKSAFNHPLATASLRSLIEAIKKTTWLEKRLGKEYVKKLFLRDFEAERKEFYRIFKNQLMIRAGTAPKIEGGEEG